MSLHSRIISLLFFPISFLSHLSSLSIVLSMIMHSNNMHPPNQRGYQMFAPPPISALPPPSWHPPRLPSPHCYGPPSPNNHSAPPISTPHAGRGRVYFQNIAVPRFAPSHETDWSTRFWGCLADPEICIRTACCPCITAGEIAEIVDHGKTSRLEGGIIYLLLSVLCVPCVYTLYIRCKMRRRFMLRGSDCLDFFAHVYCMYVSLCREHRELYNMGYDPSVGWHENMEREKNAVAVFTITPPLVEGEMRR